MEKLWAPWRVKYIRGLMGSKGCFMCKYAKNKKQDAKNHVLLRSKLLLVVMNAFPYNNGHLMVAPYRHVGEIQKLTKDEMLDLMATLSRSISILKKALKPDGFNVGINIGKVAGAGLPGHLHIHVVPRWNGDTNFMPVLGETKVVSQALDETFKMLKNSVK